MYVTGFNPYDSDTWPDPDEDNIPEILPDGAQPLPYPLPQIPIEETSSESETESDAPPIPVSTSTSDNDVVLTDLANVRQVLAARTNYSSGRLGNHLHGIPGLIILPLQAISTLRIPHGHHVANPRLLIFQPKKDLANYPELANLVEAMGVLYPQ